MRCEYYMVGVCCSRDLILILLELEVCVTEPSYPTLESAQVTVIQHKKWHVTYHRARVRCFGAL